MHWLVYAFGITIGAACIHIFAKSQSLEILPIPAMFVGSFAFFAFSALLFFGSGQSVGTLSVLPSKAIYMALATGFFISITHFCVFFMYNANAPLTIAVPIVRMGAVLVAVTVGLLVFKEQLSPQKMFGIVLACISIFFMTRK